MTRNLLLQQLPDVLEAVLAAGAVPVRPEGADSGIVGMSRTYLLLPGAAPGPVNAPPGFVAGYDGYVLLVFVCMTAERSRRLIGRRKDDRDLALLQQAGKFEAAMRAHPVTAAWTGAYRAEPVSQVHVAANLCNRYRRQPHAVAGLLSIGDSVCTTNPAGGRGATLAIASALAMADIVTSGPRDPGSWAADLDHWCDTHIRPWFADTLLNDEVTLRRWRGEPLDLAGPIAPDLVMTAAQADPSIMPAVAPYNAMLSTSACLDPGPRARAADPGRRLAPAPAPGPHSHRTDQRHRGRPGQY